MPRARSAPAKRDELRRALTAWRLPGGLRDELGDRRLAGRPEVVPVLQQATERDAATISRFEPVAVEAHERLRPVDRLGHARELEQVAPRSACTKRAIARARRSSAPGTLRAQDADLLLEAGMLDVEVQAAAPERVADLARAVRGQDDVRRVLRPDRAELRDRDLEVGQHLEQERLEAVVGAIDLVDEQHRRPVAPGDRAQQRPLEQVVARRRSASSSSPGRAPRARAIRSAQHLPRVVPLVERGLDVEALVALQADQLGAEQAREHLRELGLADAGVALDEQGLAHLAGEEDRGRDGGLGDVAVALHRRLQRADFVVHASPGPRSPPAAREARRARPGTSSRQPPQQKYQVLRAVLGDVARARDRDRHAADRIDRLAASAAAQLGSPATGAPRPRAARRTLDDLAPGC